MQNRYWFTCLRKGLRFHWPDAERVPDLQPEGVLVIEARPGVVTVTELAVLDFELGPGLGPEPEPALEVGPEIAVVAEVAAFAAAAALALVIAVPELAAVPVASETPAEVAAAAVDAAAAAAVSESESVLASAASVGPDAAGLGPELEPELGLAPVALVLAPEPAAAAVVVLAERHIGEGWP